MTSPNRMIPQGGASGFAYQRAHSMQTPLGAPAGPPNTDYKPGPETDDKWAGWTQIPAYYTVSVLLDTSVDAATGSQSTPLRPEPFVLKRITFSTVEDVLATGIVWSSMAARLVEISWQDEFTRFLGDQPCSVLALFGDAAGFLDLSAGILFQGRQTLSVNLKRIIANPLIDTNVKARWDFNFQGVALLPPGVQVSGSVT